MYEIVLKSKMNFSKFFMCAVLLFFLCQICISSDKKRPYYNIGHMVNSIGEIEEFLNKGSNVLEIDVQFFPNGSVKELYHGSFCDCGRYCEAKANLKEYLVHLRSITDPSRPDNYYEQLLMLFFDLKLQTSNDTMESGRDVARHVLDYLWSENEDREQEMRVLIFFDKMKDEDVVLGFRSEFQRQGQTYRLKDVGFDGGSGYISDIKKTFGDLKIENVWIGDGILNCIGLFWPNKRLKEAIYIRGSSDGFIDKVYKWTIDKPSQMRDALRLGVDGIITNRPNKLLDILEEDEFKKSYKIATVRDNPFQKHIYE